MKTKNITLLSTKTIDLIDVTKHLVAFINKVEQKDGLVNVYIPHSTAGITINEVGDHDVKYDLQFAFKRLSPKLREYIHKQGNSDAHLLSSLAGCTTTIPFVDKKLLLGEWQGVFFCEFDGPRERTMIISIV